LEPSRQSRKKKKTLPIRRTFLQAQRHQHFGGTYTSCHRIRARCTFGEGWGDAIGE
jgi:hypothetical protein